MSLSLYMHVNIVDSLNSGQLQIYKLFLNNRYQMKNKLIHIISILMHGFPRHGAIYFFF